MRGRSGQAIFTPVGEATFELADPATFEPVSGEGWTKQEIEDLFMDSDEDRFLRGETKYVQSSNVEWFQWLGFYPDGQVQDQLYVGFKDGSTYEYSGISLSEALLFFRADSPGGAVWDHLRIRGTVFGYKKSYRLISGSRVWTATNASQARHQAIPAYGEPQMPFGTYHPELNWQGAPGVMGMPGASLSARHGSKKRAYFTPVQAHQGR